MCFWIVTHKIKNIVNLLCTLISIVTIENITTCWYCRARFFLVTFKWFSVPLAPLFNTSSYTAFSSKQSRMKVSILQQLIRNKSSKHKVLFNSHLTIYNIICYYVMWIQFSIYLYSYIYQYIIHRYIDNYDHNNYVAFFNNHQHIIFVNIIRKYSMGQFFVSKQKVSLNWSEVFQNHRKRAEIDRKRL